MVPTRRSARPVARGRTPVTGSARPAGRRSPPTGTVSRPARRPERGRPRDRATMTTRLTGGPATENPASRRRCCGRQTRRRRRRCRTGLRRATRTIRAMRALRAMRAMRATTSTSVVVGPPPAVVTATMSDTRPTKRGRPVMERTGPTPRTATRNPWSPGRSAVPSAGPCSSHRRSAAPAVVRPSRTSPGRPTMRTERRSRPTTPEQQTPARTVRSRPPDGTGSARATIASAPDGSAQREHGTATGVAPGRARTVAE